MLSWLRLMMAPPGSGGCLASEWFLERAQIDLVAPGRRMLPVDLPVGLGDRVDIEQAVRALLRAPLRETAVDPLAVDAAVDHDMRDMQALRPELARHGLRDGAQARLGGREGGETRPPAQAAAGAREDHRAAPERRQ